MEKVNLLNKEVFLRPENMSERSIFNTTINVVDSLRSGRGATVKAYLLNRELDIVFIKTGAGVKQIVTSSTNIISPCIKDQSFKLPSDLSSSAEE